MMITQKKWLWTILLALPLVVVGAIYANSQVYANAQAHAYICPLTGEELSCPQCCPLNQAPCDQSDDGEDGQ